MTADPGALALTAALVLEDGRRWGEAAEPWQWDDAKAVLSGRRPRWHYWLRARGMSKTTDAAALAAGVAYRVGTPAEPLLRLRLGRPTSVATARRSGRFGRTVPAARSGRDRRTLGHLSGLRCNADRGVVRQRLSVRHTPVACDSGRGCVMA